MAGYQTNTWNESITATETLKAYVTQNQAVTLTLYVHSGSSSGPVLSGVQVTGQYANGTAFSQTTNSSGYVTLTGRRDMVVRGGVGRVPDEHWNESITATETLQAYVTQNQAVTLTLYVRSGSSSGPVLSGFR